jgi:hypothetical protein
MALATVPASVPANTCASWLLGASADRRAEHLRHRRHRGDGGVEGDLRVGDLAGGVLGDVEFFPAVRVAGIELLELFAERVENLLHRPDVAIHILEGGQRCPRFGVENVTLCGYRRTVVKILLHQRRVVMLCGVTDIVVLRTSFLR